MTKEDYRDLVKELIRKSEVRLSALTPGNPEYTVLSDCIEDQYTLMRTMYALQKNS